MKTPLLKGSNFNQNFQELVLRVQSIKRKNDQYQRLVAQQIDSAMAQQILQEKQILDKQIDQTKRILQEMDKFYKQPPQKNKLKQTKKQYEKQIARYKQIISALLQKSVIRAEMRNSRRNSVPIRNRQSQQRLKDNYPNRQSSHLTKELEIQIDNEFQHKILMERKKQLGVVQEKFQRVNQILIDQSSLVNQQGNMVDVIGEEMLKAEENVEKANSQLEQGMISQKKSRKKQCCLIFFVLLLIIMGLGVVYFLFFTE